MLTAPNYFLVSVVFIALCIGGLVLMGLAVVVPVIFFTNLNRLEKQVRVLSQELETLKGNRPPATSAPPTIIPSAGSSPAQPGVPAPYAVTPPQSSPAPPG